MVGDQERIDVDLAHTLVTRLHAAGLELHQALNEGVTDHRQHIASALVEIDDAIQLIRRAAVGFEATGGTSPTS